MTIWWRTAKDLQSRLEAKESSVCAGQNANEMPKQIGQECLMPNSP
jgi:hypothetical protein